MEAGNITFLVLVFLMAAGWIYWSRRAMDLTTDVTLLQVENNSLKRDLHRAKNFEAFLTAELAECQRKLYADFVPVDDNPLPAEPLKWPELYPPVAPAPNPPHPTAQRFVAYAG